MNQPERTCVGCRAKRPQPALVRLVSDGNGGLLVGRSHPGRGAWICADTAGECGALALKRNAFSRALRTGVRADAVPPLAIDGADGVDRD